MNRLSIQNLCKSYNKKEYALKDFSCEFTNGVYGLLGPNGAGKSTLMNIITTNIQATSGKVLYNDVDIETMGKEYKKHVGYMPQSQKVYPGFTLERFLFYMAALKGMKKKEAREEIPRLMKLVNLSDCAHKKIGQFSGGMRQRALLAQALLGQPEIIILDEPTAGLDPKERIRIRNIISEIALQRIVIIATHVVQDVELIAKDIILLQNGELIKMADSEKLCEEIIDKVFEIKCEEKLLPEISEKFQIGNITKKSDILSVRVLAECEPVSYEYEKAESDLEDVYLYYFSEYES